MPKKLFSIKEILHLAKLANLQLNKEELNKYLKQFEETIEYVKNLDKLDTKKVIPISQTTSLTNVFFEDGIRNKRQFKKEEAMDNTKNKKHNYFVVNRIV